MTDINALANGCSSANTIFKADCRDNVDFDLSQCHGHSKGHAFSMDDCSAVCLGRDDCAMIQHHSSGLCWFYDAPDPEGTMAEPLLGAVGRRPASLVKLMTPAYKIKKTLSHS